MGRLIEIRDGYNDYDSSGLQVATTAPHHQPVVLESSSSNPHVERFMTAALFAVGFVALTCNNPYAAAGAVVCFAETIRQARQIPELN